MDRKAVTLIELMLAITIMGFALVPMAGSILSYFKGSRTLEGSLDYTNRAQNILNDLLDAVSYKELQTLLESGGASAINVSDFSQSSATITDLTTIPKKDGTLVCPLSAKDPSSNTEKGAWLVDGTGTYFVFQGVKYYFTMKLTNIPLQFHWRSYTLNTNRNSIVSSNYPATRKTIGAPDVKTLDKAGSTRDMYMQILLTIKWREYNRDLEYDFVTFKANLDDSNDY